LGTVTTICKANVTLTGQEATSALGTVVTDAEANVTPSGQEATGAVGSVNFDAEANVTLTGLTGTLGAVSVTTDAEANVTITDTLVATLGNVSVDIDAEATVIITTGVAGTSALGTVTQRSNNTIPIVGSRQPPQANSFVGAPTVIAKADVTLTGLSVTGELSNLNVWGLIDEDQTPNWQEVAA
jgi:hypothetical protein